MFKEIAWYSTDGNSLDGFQIDYDKDKNIFRISFFEDGHFVDEAFFDKKVFKTEN